MTMNDGPPYGPPEESGAFDGESARYAVELVLAMNAAGWSERRMTKAVWDWMCGKAHGLECQKLSGSRCVVCNQPKMAVLKGPEAGKQGILLWCWECRSPGWKMEAAAKEAGFLLRPHGRMTQRKPLADVS